MKSELIENRLIVWDLSDSKKLFTNGYYGKPIGISKPKSNDIDAPLILDLIEGYYLMNKSKIQIYKNFSKSFEYLNEKLRTIYANNFKIIYLEITL